MADAPPSLGDVIKSKLKLIHEEEPLPSDRKLIVARFEAILNQGLVQKVIMEVGKPIKVTRYAKEGAEPPPEFKEEELYANARNAPMEEFDSTGMNSFHDYIFRAMGLITQKRLKARAFLMSNEHLLRACLDVDKFWDLSQVCGVEVVVSTEIPKDVLLLTASEASGEDIVFSLRMLMDERNLK